MKLNKPVCATSFGNTGFGECTLDPAEFEGAIQVGKDFSIATGDLATLFTKFDTARHAAIGARLFPYKNFISVTDNTEEPSITTTDYGAKYKTRDGDYDITFRYIKGGVQAHQEFQKNEGDGKYFYFFDKKGVLYGYKSGGALKPIPVDQFLVLPWRFATGADKASYLLRFIISQVYLNKGNLGFLSITDFNIRDIEGLQNVDLILAGQAGNVLTVQARSSISDVDMHATYGTVMAAAGGWKCINKATGATVTITTVASTTGGWTVTLDSTTYTGLTAGAQLELSWVAPSVLSQSPYNVKGFETVEPLIITKSA